MPTQQEIAEHLGITQQAVSAQMQPLGLDWRNESMTRIRLAYLENLRAVAAGHRSADGQDLTRERALTERVDRELKELTLAEKKGQLVNVQQLEAALTQMVVAFRTEVMGLADRLKDDLDALYSIDVDLQVLSDPIHECLQQLARYDASGAGTAAPPGGQADAAIEGHDDAVGADLSAPECEGIGQAGQVQPGSDAVGAGDARGAGRSGGVAGGGPEVGPDCVD